MSDKLDIEVTAWSAYERGTLRGFCEIYIPQLKLHLADIGVHKHESGKQWASLPGKPRLDRDRKLVLTADGKVEYSKIIWWHDRAVGDAFSARVIEALDRYLVRERSA